MLHNPTSWAVTAIASAALFLYAWRTFKAPLSVEVIKPGVLIWLVSPSTFKKGTNSGGPPDSSDRIQPRPKSQSLKATNSTPSPTKANEKPTGLSRRASGLRLRCERRDRGQANSKGIRIGAVLFSACARLSRSKLEEGRLIARVRGASSPGVAAFPAAA